MRVMVALVMVMDLMAAWRQLYPGAFRRVRMAYRRERMNSRRRKATRDTDESSWTRYM